MGWQGAPTLREPIKWLDDLADAVDAYLLDPTDANREVLRQQRQRVREWKASRHPSLHVVDL